MSSINDRINLFINEYDLPDTQVFRDALGDFVSGCWADHFKIVQGETIPDDKPTKGASTKVSKENKIEDPTECKSRDDLRNCTSGTLNEFCKKQGLRVGGNKTEIMDRVWRYLQGNNSEEDISPRNKPKKEKKVQEKHDCYGCTSKGTPCAVAATVEVDGCWFCWRHEENAADIIASKSEIKSVKKSESKKTESKKVSKKTSKKVVEELQSESESDTGSKKNSKKTSKKTSKKPEPEPVVESESEEDQEEEEEEDQEDQQETDEE